MWPLTALSSGPMTKKKARTRNFVAVVLLYLGLATILTSLHGYNVNYGEKADKRAARHERIISLIGESPWAYRLAVPFTAEAVQHALSPLPIPEQDRREAGYLGVRFLSMFFTFLALHRFQRFFLPTAWAFGGTVFMAALHGPSFEHYWFQPASAPDLMFWTLGAMVTMQGRDRWLFPMLVLGALNRETVVFLIPIHFALRWGDEPVGRLVARCALMAIVWLVPFVAVRQVVEVTGWADGKNAIGFLRNNLTRTEWIAYAIAFAGAWLALPFLGWKHVPPKLRWLILVMGPYLGLILAFGRIREVRLLLPLGLAFIPAMLCVLKAWDEEAQAPAEPQAPADAGASS